MRLLHIGNSTLRRFVRSHLRKNGCTIYLATDINEAVDKFAEAAIDVVLLDMDDRPTDLVEQLRRRWKSIPIFVMRQNKDVAECVSSLRAGADDYLAYPFDLDEMTARLERLGQRRSRSNEKPELQWIDVSLTVRTRIAIVNGRELELRRRETLLLAMLLKNAGSPVSRVALMQNLYTDDEYIASNTIDVQVHRLRKFLSDYGSSLQITTIRGIGYALKMRARSPDRSAP